MKLKLFMGKVFKKKSYMDLVRFSSSLASCLTKLDYSGRSTEVLIRGLLPQFILSQEVSPFTTVSKLDIN